jgi:L-amino acid N-acyltransferase YncA
VAGFARLTPYSSRACYAGVWEASVSVAASYRGASVGRRMLDAVAADAERRGYWKLVGLRFPENRRSVALCASAGFREVGVHRRHGRLPNRGVEIAHRGAQYGGKSAYQSPRARKARQKRRLAASSSSERSMSGT